MKHENGRFTFTRNEIRALLQFSSKDETRAHINAVWFDPPNGRAVATCGHTCAIVKNGATSDTPSFLVARDDLERASKLLRRQSDRLEVYQAPDGVQLDVNGGRALAVSAVDATFPPIDAVVPQRDEQALVVGRWKISGDYLGYLQLVQRAAESCGIVCYPPPGELDPTLWRVESQAHACTWTAVIMPVRI